MNDSESECRIDDRILGFACFPQSEGYFYKIVIGDVFWFVSQRVSSGVKKGLCLGSIRTVCYPWNRMRNFLIFINSFFVIEKTP